MKYSIHADPLKFNEAKHEYSLDHHNVKFISATTFIHRFFRPFNEPKIAQNLVDTHPKYAGRTVEEVMKDWNQSATDGTTVHNALENAIIYYNKEKSFGEPEKITDCNEVSIAKLEHGHKWLVDTFGGRDELTLFPELRVFTLDHALAGTMDLLVHNKEKDHYTILDWKTNKALRKKAFNNATGNTMQTGDLPDCNFMHYSLQLSLYRYILEEKYNLKINNQALIHLTPYSADVHECEYLKDNIVDMLKIRRQECLV